MRRVHVSRSRTLFLPNTPLLRRCVAGAFVFLFALFAFAFAMPLSASADEYSSNFALFGTPGSHTFTVPDGVSSVRVFAIGGGGGGGAGSGGWGSGGGAGCGGAVAGGVLSVTPGQKLSLYVGYGGPGGNGAANPNAGGCPWCGSFSASSNGSSGGASGIGSISATGGSWGRTGYYNLYGWYTGGYGGGSGGGGGGNGWPGFQGLSTPGGTAGSNDPNNGSSSGGYCVGSGWSIDPGSYITNTPWSAGQGGQTPYQYSYNGGGGGGGVVINNSGVSGSRAPGSCSWGCQGSGGAGYGGGGGGQGLDYQGAGGAGAPGAVYLEWDGTSTALSCSVSFDENPLEDESTTIRWTSMNASLFYINGVGYVSGSGSAQVYAPGDYSGYVSGIGGSASCTAVLEGDDSCVATSFVCEANGNVRDSCGRVTSCQYGCSATTNQCLESCTTRPICDAAGAKVLNACNGNIVDDCASRGRMCLSGVCALPSISFSSFDAGYFTASGHLQAVPSLVRSGETTRIYWNAVNAASCSVTGANGDAWDGLFSGVSGKTTLPILSATTYTLLCAALQGAIPSSVVESVVVNVLPVFEEI